MKGTRILLVEDGADIRRSVGIALRDEGCEVSGADSCKTALIEASTRQPDLAIVDPGLPDAGG